jgi:hypothetical protein
MPFGRLERWKLGSFAPFSVIRFWELDLFGVFKYFFCHRLTQIVTDSGKDSSSITDRLMADLLLVFTELPS